MQSDEHHDQLPLRRSFENGCWTFLRLRRPLPNSSIKLLGVLSIMRLILGLPDNAHLAQNTALRMTIFMVHLPIVALITSSHRFLFCCILPKTNVYSSRNANQVLASSKSLEAAQGYCNEDHAAPCLPAMPVTAKMTSGMPQARLIRRTSLEHWPNSP